MKPQLSDPPRNVPLLVTVQLLFGRILGQVGWFLLGFGMIFFWAFAMNSDPAAPYVFRGELGSSHGWVTLIEETRFSEGGGEDDEGTPVLAYHYRFTNQGRSYKGISYRLEGDDSIETRLDVGSAVTVEFPKGRPGRSRIRGMRSAPFGGLTLLVGIFPLIGLLLAVVQLRQGWKTRRFLKYGKTALGRLVARERTNISINDQAVYKLTYEFDVSSGQKARITVRTHRAEHMAGDGVEPLLYDTARPSHGTTMDRLPGPLRIEEDGSISVRNVRSNYLALALPMLTIVGHGTYILIRYVL